MREAIAMIVIIGLTPIELGSRLPSATYSASAPWIAPSGADDPGGGVGMDPGGPHRVKGLQAQGAGWRRRGLEVADPALGDGGDARDLGIDLAGPRCIEQLRRPGDPEHQVSGIVAGQPVGDP